MSATLASRLNQILPRITSADFLSSEGIGNEIACYIFDYPAEDELEVDQELITWKQRQRDLRHAYAVVARRHDGDPDGKGHHRHPQQQHRVGEQVQPTAILHHQYCTLRSM